MTITVNTPDGGTASFPDDTDPGTITSVMKAKFGGPASSGYGDNDSLASEAGNTAYRAANTGTLGALDWGLAGIHKLERATGYDPNATDIDQIRKQNDDWQSAHPLLALGGDVVGYGAGLGKLGIAARLAKGAEGLGVGSGLARIAGGAGEAAGVTAAGDIGHGEAPGSDVLTSAALGGALGPLASKGSKVMPVGKSIAALEADKDATLQTIAQNKVGNIKPYQDFTAARSSISPGAQSGITGPMKSKLDDIQQTIANSSDLNAKDLWSMRKNINDAATSNEDRVAAKTVGDALHNIAPADMDAASLAHAQFKDAGMLDDALSGKISQADVIARAQAGVDPASKNFYSPAGRAAMTDLANAGPGPWNKWLQEKAAQSINTAGKATALGYGGHFLGGLAGDAGLGELFGLSKGISKNASGVGGAIVNQVAKRLPIASKASAKRAILAARASVGGQPATAAMYQQPDWLAQAARRGLLSQGAAGNV